MEQEERAGQQQKIELERVFKTAEMAAYLRSFSDIPYAQEISALAGAEKTFQEIFGSETGKNLQKRAPRFEARFKCVSALAKKSGTKNILELASGLSTRGLIFSEDPEVNFLQTDLNVEKLRTLANQILHSEQRKNLWFQSLDVLNQKEFENVAAGLPGELTVISEGLLVYLDRDQQIRIAIIINDLLKKRGGVWITPDFATKSDRARSYGSSSEQKVAAYAQKDIVANSFNTDEDIQNFLISTSFKARVFDQLEVAGIISSAKALGLDQEIIRRNLAGRKVYVLTTI